MNRGVDGLAGDDRADGGRAAVDGDQIDRAGWSTGDTLPRDAVDRIEKLHAAVVRDEAERGVGLLRGRRRPQPTEAESTEAAFLAEHGFATYNDYRMRIRRSTEADGPDMERELGGDLDNPWFADSDPMTFGLDAAATWSSDHRIGDLDSSQQRRAETGESVDRASSPPASPDQGKPMTATPQALLVVGLPGAVRRLTQPLYAALEAEVDRFVACRVDAADRRAAEIAQQASTQAAEIVEHAFTQAAEILDRAARTNEAARTLAENVVARSEELLGLTDELPAGIASARDHVSDGLRAWRDVADRATDQVRLPGSPTSGNDPAGVGCARSAPQMAVS